jgi:3alpha(or 20beta)-hydroxysteroid dehydrogenase
LSEDFGEAVGFARLDVTDSDEWNQAVGTALEQYGRLDFLLNAAGVMHRQSIEDESPAAFEKLWRINCLGPFLGARAVLPALRSAGGGAVVNWSSTCGLLGWASMTSYAASKWAVRGLSKCAALELAVDNVRVNTIIPGPVATPMTVDPLDPGAFAARTITPLGRVGEADEVAELALFLVSARSAYITGAEFIIDGGQTAGPVSVAT